MGSVPAFFVFVPISNGFNLYEAITAFFFKLPKGLRLISVSLYNLTKSFLTGKIFQ